jgi:hypothetical protein
MLYETTTTTSASTTTTRPRPPGQSDGAPPVLELLRAALARQS